MTRVIISGGGTGGHIFPAIAIANAIKYAEPAAEILFIGAEGRMEMERVPAAGYQIEGLRISGLQRRLTLKNFIVPYRVITSLMKAERIIRRFNPDVVIGVGGYASGPTLRMAMLKKIPTLIQEQNSYPGLTNKILGPNADKICVAYDGMEHFFPKNKLILTGNPVRQNIVRRHGQLNEALLHFGLEHDKKTILVTGGSLGSGTINRSIRNYLVNKGKADIQIIWQTGSYYYPEIHSDEELNQLEHVKILPFIDRMDLAYSAADVIISRAGAIAISELCLVGKPIILIPSPNVTEDHQTKNARALVIKNAALMLKDSEAVERLPVILEDLLKDESRQADLSENILSLAIGNAAERIAHEAFALAKQKNRK
ncbi:MAG TPA: undecaprenyldiphospho-muramoylpentapeptide beta-N-acetylglucosaminyltransferase [Bacteroidales bacterium]|nr:undecaprenyldiphospho-muramoylpentapeptide beta-N-acetylglucosaminyltransferase [Bacteroidales bacterium]